ncbi:MAG: hypothetical protein EON52_12400, partial [Actinomycetales bacterium]
MSKAFTLGVTAIVATSVLAVAPAMAGGGSGDDRDRGLHSLLLSRGGSLDVVGLATNGTQLVRFKT